VGCIFGSVTTAPRLVVCLGVGLEKGPPKKGQCTRAGVKVGAREGVSLELVLKPVATRAACAAVLVDAAVINGASKRCRRCCIVRSPLSPAGRIATPGSPSLSSMSSCALSRCTLPARPHTRTQRSQRCVLPTRWGRAIGRSRRDGLAAAHQSR
jgi:hypothetical protein